MNKTPSATAQDKYRKSEFIQTVPCLSNYSVIYHSFFGRAMYLYSGAAAQLDLFTTPRPLSHKTPFPAALLNEFLRRGFIVNAGSAEREEALDTFKAYVPQTISGLCLNMSTACNFRCFHCIHFAGNDLDNRSAKPKRMSFETTRTAIDWIARGVMESGESNMAVNFSGGEPLMNWDTIARTLEYTHKNIQPRLDVTFSLNTNASLITPDIARVLKKHEVKMIVSLDGIEKGNDRVRRTVSGRSTFHLIQRGFACLKASDNPVRAFHINLTSENFDCLDDALIDFLSQNRILSVTLEPDLTDQVNQPVSALVNRIMDLRNMAQERGISITGYWERPFAKIIDSSPDQPAHFCRSMGGKTMDVLPDGSLYGCSYTNLKLGNLDQFKQGDSPSKLMRSPLFTAMLDSRRIGQIEECRGCELEGVCGGGCFATALHAQKKNNQSITRYRCDLYRQITRQLLLNAMEKSTPH
jgi:uncharacterized protein